MGESVPNIGNQKSDQKIRAEFTESGREALLMSLPHLGVLKFLFASRRLSRIASLRFAPVLAAFIRPPHRVCQRGNGLAIRHENMFVAEHLNPAGIVQHIPYLLLDRRHIQIDAHAPKRRL